MALTMAVLSLFVATSRWQPASAHVAHEEKGEPLEVSERLGSRVPLGLIFRDESGKAVRLGELISGPTVIIPGYYRCTNVCSFQQARMAETVGKLEKTPVRDYRIISISFDETEGAELASRSKKMHLTPLGEGFPPEGWRFLTGDAASIRPLLEAIGFGIRRQGGEFIHPVASIVVSGDGTIVRYLYGITILPKDLSLAIGEARSGIIGAPLRKMVDFCFTYDPAGRTYVFNLLRVSATVVIITLAAFMAFLLFGGKKRRKERPEA